MYHGILSAGIEYKDHWTWPSRLFWPFWHRILGNVACLHDNSSQIWTGFAKLAPHYGNQTRGYLIGGRPLWPAAVPRLAARSSQSNPRGSGPEVLKRERGHVTAETGVAEVGVFRALQPNEYAKYYASCDIRGWYWKWTSLTLIDLQGHFRHFDR